MPQCKVMIWNVEDFGSFTNLKFGSASNLGTLAVPMPDNRLDGTLWGIAQVILAYNTDVLIMQEFRHAGIADLATLQAFLDEGVAGTWNYDWIPGSVNPAVVRAAVIPFASLGFHGRGNSEGYAVFWKNTVTLAQQANKMSRGRNNTPANHGYINLLTEGFGYNVGTPATPPITGNWAAAHNLPLDFPPPDSRGLKAGKRNRAQRAGHAPLTYSTDLEWANVRRPCLVNINSATYGNIPIIAHHGPNAGKAPMMSMLCASLFPEFHNGKALLPANRTALIYGGDLNTVNQQAFNTAANLLGPVTVAHPNTFQMTDDTAVTAVYQTAHPTLAKFKHRRTQTRYITAAYAVNPNTLITNGDNYEGARDLLFHGGLTNVVAAQTGVVQVLDDLQNAASALAIRLFRSNVAGGGGVVAWTNLLWQSLDFEHRYRASIAPASNHFCLPNQVTAHLPAIDLRTPFTAAVAGNKRYAQLYEAAILYRCFISDHLPLMATFDI